MPENKIAILGLGYVGLPQQLCIASSNALSLPLLIAQLA